MSAKDDQRTLTPENNSRDCADVGVAEVEQKYAPLVVTDIRPLYETGGHAHCRADVAQVLERIEDRYSATLPHQDRTVGDGLIDTVQPRIVFGVGRDFF
jgi:hypothetical protein